MPTAIFDLDGVLYPAWKDWNDGVFSVEAEYERLQRPDIRPLALGKALFELYQQAGWAMYIVTARTEQFEHPTQNWLDKHFDTAAATLRMRSDSMGARELLWEKHGVSFGAMHAIDKIEIINDLYLTPSFQSVADEVIFIDDKIENTEMVGAAFPEMATALVKFD